MDNLLYHYTSMNTFCSMMEHSLYTEGDKTEPTHLIMWAGHYSFQNDPTECKLYFKGLEKAVQDYCKGNSYKLKDDYSRLVGCPDDDLDLYIISFSEQEDDLTMWRGYGQNGDGISLGFNFDHLPEAPGMQLYDKKNPQAHIQPQGIHLADKTDRPVKCIYTKADDVEKEDEVKRRILKILQNKENRWNGVNSFLTNSKEAPLYKHIKYEAEKEHRIITTKDTPKFRNGEKGLPVPYIEIGIPLVCLSKIIIGPCQSSSEAVARMKKYLDVKGINTGKVEIVSSQIPYRNRI